MTALILSTDIAVRLHHFGTEKLPVMVVDQVLADPDALIAEAARAGFYVPEHTRYPGLNAALPEDYYQTVVTALRGPIEAAFGLSRLIHLKYFGFFALATTPASVAVPLQKIPHYDTPDPGRLAMVHYLCRGDYGGTGFFRHRTTGFESVDGVRQAAYITAAAPELERSQDALVGYAGDDMADYEMTGAIDMVFNRLIVYRANSLHSGLLNAAPFSADPASGRLTANGFVEAAASHPRTLF